MSGITYASYWSATADIGRKFPTKSEGRSGASYFSSTADVGRPDKISISDTVTEATYYNTRGVPPVANRGEAGSAYRTQQTIADLEKRRTGSSISMKLKIGDDRALNNQDTFFVRLKDRLATLGKNLLQMERMETFNPYTASSSKPEAVNATPDIQATKGTYSISVDRLAQSHQVSSDKQSDPYAVLNLSGSISINGYSITIDTTDTMADIRDKINQGEDANKNGTLETMSEDSNGNGTLDLYYTPSIYIGNGTYAPSFSYYEDLNYDGNIDTSEDINNSGTLDGGSGQTMAEARIEDGRLIITNLKGADTSLTLSDPDNILESLGFYKRGNMNEKQLKTSLDSKYNIEPVTAKLAIDNTSHTANDNVVDNLIPSITLSLKDTTTKEVKLDIYKDTQKVVQRIEAFSASFNSVMELIDKENIDHLQIQDNIRIQDFTIDLARSAHAQIGSLPAPPKSMSDLGLPPAESSPNTIDVASIEGLNSPSSAKSFQNEEGGQPGLFARLSRIGITSMDDYTLSLDKNRLADKIASDPMQVYSVFNAEPDGVAKRLGRDVTYAITQPNGMIEYQRQLLGHYRQNSMDVAQTLEKQVAPLVTQSTISMSSSILAPVKA